MLLCCLAVSDQLSTRDLFRTYVLITSINEGHFLKEPKGIQIQNLAFGIELLFLLNSRQQGIACKVDQCQTEIFPLEFYGLGLF